MSLHIVLNRSKCGGRTRIVKEKHPEKENVKEKATMGVCMLIHIYNP